MFTELLPMILTTVAVLIGLMLFVAASCEPALLSDRASTYTSVPYSQRSACAETMVGQEMLQSTLPDRPGWKTTQLDSLRDVQDFLDYLENQKVAESEVHTLGEHCFAVRWK